MKRKKIAIYTRHKLTNYAFKLCTGLSDEHNVIIFSEDNLNISGIINLENFNDSNINISIFNDCEIAEIFGRCRVLRSIKKDLGLKLFHKALNSILIFLEKYDLDIIIAPRIDDYFLDIMERLCAIKSIRFVGLWRSPFYPSKFFLTSRGDFTKVNNPTLTEINELISALSDDRFMATSISKNNYSFIVSIKHFLKLYFRSICLELIRRFSSNKYRYRELATRFWVQEYRVPIMKSIYFYLNWQSKLDKYVDANDNRKVFLALQVNPESTIDYYCPNLNFINIKTVTLDIINLFVSHGFKVVVKDHPNMLGVRNSDFLRKLDNIEGCIVVPPTVPSTYLINNSCVTFTWSGTVAIQAQMMRRKSICVCSPFYNPTDGFYKINDLSDLEKLLTSGELVDGIVAKEDQLYGLAHHILSTHLTGDVFLHNNNIPYKINATVDSLNKIISKSN